MAARALAQPESACGNVEMLYRVSLAALLAFGLLACGDDGGSELGTNGENIGGVIRDDDGLPVENRQRSP